jgi:hypothetical protein
VALDVQSVAQTQVFELVVGQFAGEKASGLIAKLRDAFVDQRPVYYVISIHSPSF